MRDARRLSEPIVVLDLETTGLHCQRDRVTAINAVWLADGRITGVFYTVVNPQRPIPLACETLNGITGTMTADAPAFADIAPGLLDFIGDAPIAAYSARFVLGFLNAALARAGKGWTGPVIDVRAYAEGALAPLRSHRLSAVCRVLGVPYGGMPQGIGEAGAIARVLQRLIALDREMGAECLPDLNAGGGARGAPGERPVVLWPAWP